MNSAAYYSTQDLIREVQAQSFPSSRPGRTAPTVILQEENSQPEDDQTEEAPPSEQADYRKQLIEIRLKAGLTQEELAEILHTKRY